MDLTISPHIAVLQNIYPDHLDYHQDFEEYKNAKLNITKFQTENDYLITAIDVPTKAKKIFIKPEPVESQLLGTHNLYNTQPSIIIGKILSLPKDEILSAIKTFKPLDTRIELVAEKNGIKFYADTLATIPEATIAAIDTLHPRVTTLIAGGHERKQNYSDLAKKILSSSIKTLILFPATGLRLAKLVNRSANSPTNIFHANSMSDAVKIALDHTRSGEICLLSPAAPSFTLFRDYRDEYDQYKAAIVANRPSGSPIRTDR